MLLKRANSPSKWSRNLEKAKSPAPRFADVVSPVEISPAPIRAITSEINDNWLGVIGVFASGFTMMRAIRWSQGVVLFFIVKIWKITHSCQGNYGIFK